MENQDELKQYVRGLISNSELKKALEVLGNAPLPPASKEIVMLLNVRWNNVKAEQNKGTMSAEDITLETNRINAALLDLTQEIGASDKSGNGKVALHECLQYTCNRNEQLEIFENYYQKNKTQFYYILGEEEQSHFGLVNRMAYEKGGYLLDIGGSNSITNKLFIKEIVVGDRGGDIDQLKIDLIKKLAAVLNIRPNDHEPLLEKKLDFIAKESPELKKMNSSDYVCILLSIWEECWEEKKIRGLSEWFIKDFCTVDLPETAPTFLFFFGVIYDEGDPQTIASVEQVVKNSSYIKVLPELDNVSKNEVSMWFKKYKQHIAPDKATRDDYMQTHFSNTEEFKMETIQIELKKIIDKINRPA